MAQKLPRPIGDYLIGNGCCYLITREAYHSWFNHGATISHSCVNYNGGQDLVQYPLHHNAKYKAFEFNKIPIEWQPILSKGNADLAKQLCDYYSAKPPVKSKPAPDQYVIIQFGTSNNAAGFYICLRSDEQALNTKGHSVKTCPRWENGIKSSGWTIHGAATLVKKFPQLSSEIKAKLQKQNPERYREWEQFYMKTYPNMQPLRPQDALKPDKKQDPTAPDAFIII